MTITWNVKSFEELTNKELYQFLNLRSEVFCVEQNVPYQDLDGKDFNSFHLSGYDETGEIVAYARILPAGMVYNEASIGRVVNSKKVRGTGAGKQLMERAIAFVEEQFGQSAIRISAQYYLVNFYSTFGFQVVGEKYIEDDIFHIEMVRY